MCHTDINTYNEITGVFKPTVNKLNGIVPPEGKIQKKILNGNDRPDGGSVSNDTAIYIP